MGFFKWQNHDADWIILMFNADLHSHVQKSESLLADAIDKYYYNRLRQTNVYVKRLWVRIYP